MLGYSQKKDGSNRTYLQYQKDLIRHLLFAFGDLGDAVIPKSEHVLWLTEKHFPYQVGRSEQTGRSKRLRCRVCYKKGVRRDSNFYCKYCLSKPGLCIGDCFAAYNSRLIYWK